MVSNIFDIQSKSDYTIVLEIVLEDLLEELGALFKKSMKNTRIQQESVLIPILEGQKKNKQKKMTYNEDIMHANTKLDPKKRKFNVDLKEVRDTLPLPEKHTPGGAMNFTFQLNETKLLENARKLGSAVVIKTSDKAPIYKNRNMFETVSDLKKFKQEKSKSKKKHKEIFITTNFNNYTSNSVLHTVPSCNSLDIKKTNEKFTLPSYPEGIEMRQMVSDRLLINNLARQIQEKEKREKEISLEKFDSDNYYRENFNYSPETPNTEVIPFYLKNPLSSFNFKVDIKNNNNENNNRLSTAPNNNDFKSGKVISSNYENYFQTDVNPITTENDRNNINDDNIYLFNPITEANVQTAYNLNLKRLSNQKSTKQIEDNINKAKNKSVYEDSFLRTKSSLKRTLDQTSATTNRNLNYKTGYFDIPLLHLYDKKSLTKRSIQNTD